MIGQRKDAKKIKRGVGGKAFPGDYNWICPICSKECRAFEKECSYCEYEEWIISYMTKSQATKEIL